MSSRFVSAGTNEQPVKRDDEWLKAQQELEEERRRKAEIGNQNDGKSLYDVLEQNKSEFNQLPTPVITGNKRDWADMRGRCCSGVL